MSVKSIERPGDKRPDVALRVTQVTLEGDILVSVSGPDPILGNPIFFSVAFCNFRSGGQSPETYQALLALAKAMEKDKSQSLA